MDPQKIYNEVNKRMKKLFGDKLRKIFLYGSYAKNKQNQDSDIDFFVIVDDTEENLQKNKYHIADIMAELSLNFDILVSITEATYKHYSEYSKILPFYVNIEQEGTEIYG